MSSSPTGAWTTPASDGALGQWRAEVHALRIDAEGARQRSDALEHEMSSHADTCRRLQRQIDSVRSVAPPSDSTADKVDA